MHISTLYNANLITGYNDTTFKPYSNITRAEFITILSKFNTLETKFNLHNFTDIDNHWAHDYIQNAYTKGWVHGYHDNTFRPNDYITRAELSYILNTALDRSIHKDSYKLRDIKTFKDLDELSWFYDSIIIATNSYSSTEKRNDKQIWNSVFKTPFEM